MAGNMPMFYSAMLLTGVNLLLRFIGTAFQVYISNQIGASGVGLLQLMMSVGGLAMIAGMAGIRTGTMYLAAEELGKQHPGKIPWVISGCIRYSILCSTLVAVGLFLFSEYIALTWLGNALAANGLRLYAAFLPATCLCGVMSGLYTAENKIKTLAAIEILEQFFSMGITISLLRFWAGNSPEKACESIILGSCCGGCFTLALLVFLHFRITVAPGKKIPLQRRLMQSAAPLAAADILKASINTVENLMVPKQLAKCSMVRDPLASFGVVIGMVFPVIMFPACILFGLAELLIPELSRCSASGSVSRIHYLVKRSLKVSLLYGTFFGGLLFLLSDELCTILYHNPEASAYMRCYALLLPILYCDTITDAMTKGLGQQQTCVKYNIITSILDVLLLYILLPHYGMWGYFCSFTICHLLNFGLSIRRLLKITAQTIPLYIPLLCAAAMIFSIHFANLLQSAPGKAVAYCVILFSVLSLLRIVCAEDLQWIKGLFSGFSLNKAKKKPA